MNYPTAHWVHVLNHYSLDQNTYYLYIKNIMIHVYVYFCSAGTASFTVSQLITYCTY